MLVEYNKLIECVSAVFTAAGMNKDDAAWTAQCLVRTSAKGVYSHGVHLIARYIDRMVAGKVNFDGKMTILSESPSTARIDGGNGIGQAVMRDATKLAVKKAKETGAAVVTGTNMQHYGAGLVYAEIAAEAGCMLTLYANAKAQVVPFGAKTGYYGTNPMTWGIPAGRYPAYILDMACSVGAWNKLAVMKAEGLDAPEGWGIDKNGNPTTNIAEIFQGGLLPFGGVKGSGLAGVAQFFSGVASGAAKTVYDLYQPDVNNYGMIVQVVDIEKFMPMDEFNERIESQIAQLLALEPVDPSRPVVYPGYLEEQKLRKALAEGVDVADAIADEIIEEAKKVDMDVSGYFNA